MVPPSISSFSSESMKIGDAGSLASGCWNVTLVHAVPVSPVPYPLADQLPISGPDPVDADSPLHAYVVVVPIVNSEPPALQGPFAPENSLPTTLSPGCPFVPSLPLAPGCPFVPALPFSPVPPVAPVAPVAPVGPAGPAAPVGPCGPAAPVAPRGPAGPRVPFDADFFFFLADAAALACESPLADRASAPPDIAKTKARTANAFAKVMCFPIIFSPSVGLSTYRRPLRRKPPPLSRLLRVSRATEPR